MGTLDHDDTYEIPKTREGREIVQTILQNLVLYICIVGRYVNTKTKHKIIFGKAFASSKLHQKGLSFDHSYNANNIYKHEQ